MPQRPSEWPSRLVAAAAVIAAVALLVFALRYAGFIGPQPVAIAPTAGPSPVAPADPAPSSELTSEAALSPAPGAITPGEGTPPGAAAGAYPGAASSSTDAAELVVEDWRGYAADADFAAAFDTNTAVPDNAITLTLASRAGSDGSPGAPEAVIGYTIVVTAPNDYAGIQRDLAPVQDWSGRRALVVWVETKDRSARQLVIQWHEASDEVWRHRIRLGDLGPGMVPVTIPLTADAWEWADWSARENGRLDLARVNHFGVFVGHAGPGSGEVRLGTIAAVH